MIELAFALLCIGGICLVMSRRKQLDRLQILLGELHRLIDAQEVRAEALKRQIEAQQRLLDERQRMIETLQAHIRRGQSAPASSE